MKVEQLQEGALCQLNIGRWAATSRMSKDKLGDEVPKEIVRAMQDLIEDKTLIKDIHSIKRQAKSFLIENSLPFPVRGVFWVRRDHIPKLDDKFGELKRLYERQALQLADGLQKMKRRFRRKYPEYYNERKYPTKAALIKRHRFTWNFFQFTIPDEETEILSPEMYKREQRKFQNMVAEMENLTLNVIGNELLKRIEALKAQCDNDSVNLRTVKAMDGFMDKWRNLWDGHVDNKRMNSIMKSLRVQMARTSADRLKNNEDFRNKASEKLGKIIGRIEAIPKMNFKRKLDV